MALYREVARKLIDDAPSIWAAYPKLVEVMRDDVQGYIVQPPQLQRDLLLLSDLAPALGMASLGAVVGPISLRR